MISKQLVLRFAIALAAFWMAGCATDNSASSTAPGSTAPQPIMPRPNYNRAMGEGMGR